MNVTGKTILVIGTQIPWIEIILLIKNPKKIVTLEYGHFVRYTMHKAVEMFIHYSCSEQVTDPFLIKVFYQFI